MLAALMLSHISQAQPETYYVDSRQSAVASSAWQSPARPDSGKGYWWLRTVASTRYTTVRFYDAGSQLIYEETLPDRYVRLTKYNVARLDNILDQLVCGRLVASVVKVQLMSDTPSEAELAIHTEIARLAAVPTETNKKGYAISVRSLYQPRFRRVLLVLTNPDRHRFTIVLRDEQKKQDVFWIPDNAKEYRHKLNVSELPLGRYTLLVKSVDNTFYYTYPFDIQH